MRNITKLDIKFPLEQLLDGLRTVQDICDWHPSHKQIGLTHSLGPAAENAWHDATGSLYYVWGDDAVSADGSLKRHEVNRRESDFKWFVKEFSHTIWRKVYDDLSAGYALGRVRLMMSSPKTCLSWHLDEHQRIHIPLITNPGARLVIENDAHHLPADGSVYLANTTLYHTAFNSGLEPRIHFVADVLGTVS